MGTRKPAARLAVPAQRYFKGKAPVKGADPLDSDSDVEEAVEPQEDQDEAIVAYGQQDEVASKPSNIPRLGLSQPAKAERSVKVELRDVRVSVEGKIIGAAPVVSAGSLGVQVIKESSSEEEEESESSEEESASEDELPKPSHFRPVFVPKRGRETLKERDAEVFDSEEAIKKREAANEERKRESHKMVGETIKRAFEEKEAPEPGKEVDDTDGLDAEAEFEAWRLRELQRIKRTKEAEVQREEERLEKERRLAMPEEQRLKEDLELANKSRDSKPKGQGVFLQKYWHKGAFFQDSDILKRHDFSAPVASQVDVSLLPKLMQVKDFGKRSRTKWTHLRAEDTNAPTKGLRADGQPITCFGCGGPHLRKDCPLNVGPLSERPSPGTGANGTAKMPRKWGNDAQIEGSRSRHDHSLGYRPSEGDLRDDRRRSPSRRDRSWDRSHHRDDRSRRSEMERNRNYDHQRSDIHSRSRSPRHRRSRSPHHDRRDDDYPERKRRRVEA